MLAHRVSSRQRSASVIFGAKGTGGDLPISLPRREWTQSRHFGQLSRFQMSRRKSVLPREMMLGALGGFDEEFVAIYSIVTSRSACDPDWNRRMS